MPRTNTKSLNTNVTPREYEVVRQCAGDLDMADYIRKLFAEDAVRQGVEWPFETRRRGKYQRKPAK